MTSPIITLEEGQIQGKTDEDYLGKTYYSFLGVPYAKAPIGDLRFKAPVPVEPWNGILDATKEGPACPSRHMIFTNSLGCEDNCLNLNVYTPHLPNDDNSGPLKPVMVWIHGGGFMTGSNQKELYGPDYLITEDIVLVAINYRLGVFGFLCLEDPSLEVPGNAGLKDMVLALKWVQKNIKNFGGDPGNVTIFGESAGGAAVHLLYLSPQTKGLFHKAIIQSGSALNPWAKGCSNGLEIARTLEFNEKDEGKILAYLKSLPARKLVDAQLKTPDPFNACKIRPYGPVVEKNATDNSFLTEEPIDIIKSGRFNQVPLIVGFTSREGMLYELIKLAQKEARELNLEKEIPFELNLEKGSEKSQKIAASIKEKYFDNKEPSESDVDKVYKLKTDNMFLHGIYTSVSSQKQTSREPIYFYKITLDTQLNFLKNTVFSNHLYLLMSLYFLVAKFGKGMTSSMLLNLAKKISVTHHHGTCHADDIFYLFSSIWNGKLEPKSEEEKQVQRMVKLWTNFAKTGNPTPDKNDQVLNIEWKPVTKEENFYLKIGKELEVKSNPANERMKFWDNICNV